MRVTFLGVGEACDERYPNTSILIRTGASTDKLILLDCGFSTPHLFFQTNEDANDLDLLWISHFHGDHFMGAPLLLLRFWEMNRGKPLFIVGPRSVEDTIRAAMELAYPRFLQKIKYPLKFMEVEPGQAHQILGLTWRTAANEHSQHALSVRIDDGERSLFYSGDGRPTAKSLALARRCDLVIHEAFHCDEPPPGHGSVQASIEFARQAEATRLALVHIARNVRRECVPEIARLIGQTSELAITVPEPGEELVL